MKMNNPHWTNQFAGWLAVASVFLAAHASALDVIDPDGLNYTGVSDNSEYNSSYTAANLFDQDVTGVTTGTILSGNEYADNGVPESFVAFQLDTVYTNVGSIFYAQRSGSNPALDKVGMISIWASPTTPFTAADPGTPPNSVIAITNATGGQWTEYLMTNTVSGQYFLLKFQQTSVGGNPGGMELRLGADLGLPPAVVTAPVDKTVYVGGTAVFNASINGTAPLIYAWSHAGISLTNGARISGADTANLVISGATLADAGAYSLTVSNADGGISASANLAVVAASTNAAETAVISQNPLAFWQFNEPAGATIALDLVGSYNGTYGAASGVGVNGPQAPAYPGFSPTNTAVETYAFTVDSAVTVPPMNISATNSVTMLAWIYQDGSQGPQQPYTGIFYCRGAGTSVGLICSGDGTQLAYQWGGNRYNFVSGLVIPTNQWTLVALVYTTNFTTLYCGTTNGIVLSAVDNYAQGGQTFAAPMDIGLDPDVGESSRTFNGVIDDVAFFNHALTSSEINAIYAAGTGIIPTLQIISQTTNLNVFQGESFSLNVQVSGLNPAYQWYDQNAPIIGATNSTYSVAGAKVTDAGSYTVVVSNQVNTVTSAVINVTVPSYLVEPVGASGAIYSGVSASSQYPDPNYVATNMFDSDLTGVALGTQLSGKDWADDGYGTAFAPAFLAFQVDQSYTVSAVLYAQRNDQAGQTIDKITSLNLWASQTTPFTAADPGTAPDATVSIPDVDAGILHAYALPATVTGQYFLLEVVQDPIVTGSNIGGNEFRLATFVTSTSLTFSNSPAGLILNWSAGTLQQADDLTGPWITAVGVTSGVPFQTTAPRRFYRITN